MEAALLKMEREAHVIAVNNEKRAGYMKTREAAYQREHEELEAVFQSERSEHAKADANASAILAVINGNLTKIRAAQENGTVVQMEPTPAQYVPGPPPPRQPIDPTCTQSYAQTAMMPSRALSQTDPGQITPTAFPSITAGGPQVPKFQRAAMR